MIIKGLVRIGQLYSEPGSLFIHIECEVFESYTKRSSLFELFPEGDHEWVHPVVLYWNSPGEAQMKVRQREPINRAAGE